MTNETTRLQHSVCGFRLNELAATRNCKIAAANSVTAAAVLYTRMVLVYLYLRTLQIVLCHVTWSCNSAGPGEGGAGSTLQSCVNLDRFTLKLSIQQN